MPKRNTRSILIFCCLVLSCSLLHTWTYGQSVDSELQAITTQLENIDKQITNIAQSTYISKTTQADATALEDELNIYAAQIDQIQSLLGQLRTTSSLSATQNSIIGTLSGAATFIEFTINNLKAYLSTNDPIEQFEHLSSHFRAQSLINQILSYLE